MNIQRMWKIVGFVLVSEGAGIIGSVFTAPAIPTWYASLVKPSWNPPSWVFGPVWTILFLLMGIAAFLVWEKAGKKQQGKEALQIFGTQLLLNVAWSVVFFGLQNPGAALLEIVVLWLAIGWTIVAFSKIDRRAAYLLVPYLLWVSFASCLNYAIWTLNR